MLLCDCVFHTCGELGVHLLGRPLRVEQEYAAVLEVGEHIVAQYVGLVMASDKVRLVDKICTADGLVRETQVGYGYAARFLGVVCEVCLRVLVGVVAYYLD